MNAKMRAGEIRCKCGNVFYFQSTREKIVCLSCGEGHLNTGEEMTEYKEEDTIDAELGE